MSCFMDITVEFLSVAFHNILFYTRVYPESVFETRRKYGVVVYRCIHPEVTQYIDLSLKTVAECLKSGQLTRIVFAITDSAYEPMAKFIFDVTKNNNFEDTADAYLIQTEQNLRAFCLTLASTSDKLTSVEENRSFTVHLHTNESTAVAMATNGVFEDFPLVEVEEKSEETERILPLRRFTVQNFNLDTYVEIKYEKIMS